MVYTHVRLHLLRFPVKRIGYLPRRHYREIDEQQNADDHEKLVVLYYLWKIFHIENS